MFTTVEREDGFLERSYLFNLKKIEYRFLQGRFVCTTVEREDGFLEGRFFVYNY